MALFKHQHEKSFDLGLQAFHACFALLMLGAYMLASLWDEEELGFFFHTLSGLLVGVLLFFRLQWLFLGSETSSWRAFDLRLSSLWTYFRTFGDAFKGTHRHLPASSWSALVMLLCGFFLAASGVAMGLGYGWQEILGLELEELHEWVADIFIVVALLHVLGVIVHELRFKDHLAWKILPAFSSVGSEVSETRKTSRWGFVLMVVYLFAAVVFLSQTVDLQRRAIIWRGTVMQLSDESEGDEKAHEESPEESPEMAK